MKCAAPKVSKCSPSSFRVDPGSPPGDNPSVSRRAGLLILLALAASAYGLLDVRQRARIDRGVKRHRTDFTVYQYAARALAVGDDPYEATNPRGYRYVYPPLLAVLLLPLAAWEPPAAALVWFALSMLAFVGALWAASRWPVWCE